MTFPSVSFTPTVARIHPQTGEILTADNPSQPRAIAVDSSGMIITTPYSSGLSKLGLMSRAFEDKSFNSIRSLNRPLGFLYGGRAQGELIVENGITGHLDLQHMTALADSTSGTTVVYVPVANTPHVTEWRASVLDVGGMASTNNITVHSVSGGLEVPGSPGTFSSVVTISTDNQLVTWRYSPAYGNWYIVECEPPILPTAPSGLTQFLSKVFSAGTSFGPPGQYVSSNLSFTTSSSTMVITGFICGQFQLTGGNGPAGPCFFFIEYSTDGGSTWLPADSYTKVSGIPHGNVTAITDFSAAMNFVVTGLSVPDAVLVRGRFQVSGGTGSVVLDSLNPGGFTVLN